MLLAEARPESLGSPGGSLALWQCQAGQHSHGCGWQGLELPEPQECPGVSSLVLLWCWLCLPRGSGL